MYKHLAVITERAGDAELDDADHGSQRGGTDEGAHFVCERGVDE